EVRDADHRCLTHFRHAPAVTGQAPVGIGRNLVATDAVRDDRRLFGIVAAAPRIVVDLAGDRRGLLDLTDRHWPAQAGKVGGQRRRDGDGKADYPQAAGQNGPSHCAPPRLPAIFSMRTAHFLKSVWREMGSVASRVTLLIRMLSSNQGT